MKSLTGRYHFFFVGLLLWIYVKTLFNIVANFCKILNDGQVIQASMHFMIIFQVIWKTNIFHPGMKYLYRKYYANYAQIPGIQLCPNLYPFTESFLFKLHVFHKLKLLVNLRWFFIIGYHSLFRYKISQDINCLSWATTYKSFYPAKIIDGVIRSVLTCL